MLVLSVIQGPDKGRKFELPDHEPQLIGRSSEALPLTDNAVSRRHAELTPDDGAWIIRDLQSQNGTFVNGVKIEAAHRLRPGDQIRTGQTLFVFGQTETRDPEVVRVVGPKRMDATVERTAPSETMFAQGETFDGSIFADAEPKAAAADHLRVIYRLTTMLSSRVMSGEEMLRGVLDIVFAEFHPERGCIMLVGPTPESPMTVAAVKYREPPADPDQAKIHVSRTILQHVVHKNEGVLCSNAMTDPRFAKGDSVMRFNIRSALCAPIRFRERTFGAIYVDSSMVNYTFTAAQLELLNAIGQHAGLALSNAELYQQKLQSERLAAMGETVATLSHAIKNILQGLRGGADVVEMGLKKDDLRIAKGGWGIFQRNLERIMGLTMNMLAFSQQRRIELELTRVGPLLNEAAALIQPVAAMKKIALICDTDAEIPPIAIDGSLLHQAVMNLVSNAIEAVEQGTGAVTIRAVYHPRTPRTTATVRQIAGTPLMPAGLEDRPTVEIDVSDNGPGIPAAKQAWIFEPFNTTKGAKGTGLGLAVAKRVAEEHGGRIVLESTEGRGATFRIFLPADLTASNDPSATAASKNSGPPDASGSRLSGESVRLS
ncbi:MAG: FHA domain-containing protein [Planctomycetes bacterium]|nr:FHA domain-containing protein [Planctomycetota bacterium]